MLRQGRKVIREPIGSVQVQVAGSTFAGSADR